MTATRVAKWSTLVALAAGWVVAALLLTRTTIPGNLHEPHVSAAAEFQAPLLHRSARYESVLRWLWVAGTLVTLAALVVLHEARAEDRGRVAARARGQGDHGRHGHDARHLGRDASGRGDRPVVGPALPARETGLRHLGARAVAEPRLAGRRADDRAHDSAPARGPLRQALVARGGAAVHGARCGARARVAVRGVDRHAQAPSDRRLRAHPPARARRRRRQHADQDRDGERRDTVRERVHDRDRPLGTRVHLGHASSTVASRTARSSSSPRTSSATWRTATSGKASRGRCC